MSASGENASEPATSLELGFAGRNLFAKSERKDHVQLLLRSLDTTTLLLISALYLCDNQTFLLLLRTACQNLYVPNALLVPPLLANTVCIITHILHSRPEGTTASRGYLHGGLLFDFVGELGPISLIRLLSYDILIFGLQLASIAVSYEYRNLVETKKQEASAPPQDIEAEEARFRREQHDESSAAMVEQNGIEMQPMLPDSDGQARKHTSATEDDDLVLILNIKESLAGAFKRSPVAPPPTSQSDVSRLSTLFDPISAARNAATRS